MGLGMLLVLSLFFFEGFARGPAVISGSVNGSQLAGLTLTDGWIRQVVYPKLDPAETPAQITSTCAIRTIVDGTAIHTHRINRCYPTAIQPTIPQLIFSNTPFFAFQYNGSHVQLFNCNDDACTDCIPGRVVLKDDCVEKPILINNQAVGTIVSAHFEENPFVMPSGMMCGHVYSIEDCSGEIVSQVCITQCSVVTTPTGPALLRLDCTEGATDAASTMSLTTCPIDPNAGPLAALIALQTCAAGPCPSGPPPNFPTTVNGCAILPNSSIAFKSFSCSANQASGSLQPLRCGGMPLSTEVKCGTDMKRSATMDGFFPKTVQGSWTPPDKFIITNPKVDTPSVFARGSFAPNGDIVLQYSQSSSIKTGVAIPLFDAAEPLKQNANPIPSKSFSSISVVVLQQQTGDAQFCAVPTLTNTGVTVTISSCSGAAKSTGLSTGAIAGIAVGAIVGGIALVVGIILLAKLASAKKMETAKSDMEFHRLRD